VQIVHAIVGSGSVKPSVVKAGLRDVLKEGDGVALVWSGRPSEGMEAVYDYILDEEFNFQMFYAEGTTPPKVFRESELGFVQKTRAPLVSAVKAVTEYGTVLFFWDEDNAESEINLVADHVMEGTKVLEMTGGLHPIEIDPTDMPVPQEVKVEDEPDEDEDEEDFTKEELEVMAAAAVKRYGARKGVAAVTKSGIIAELFPDTEDEVDDEEEPPAAADLSDDLPALVELVHLLLATNKVLVSNLEAFLAKLES
jgi:hypothetical protein